MIIKSADPNNPRVTYTTDHDKMTPGQIFTAWINQKITVFQFSEWQARHNIYFNSKGEQIK